MRRRVGILFGVIVCGGCEMSPLSNKIEIGKNPFIVFVGEGRDHRTDLFAVEPSGGTVAQLTFTPVVESQPRVVPDGSLLAFLRMKDTLPGTLREIVVMNLLSGSEKKLGLPADAGSPLAIAWSDDLQWLLVATDQGRWRIAPPPHVAAAERVPETELAAVDSVLGRWAGLPRFARIVPCGSGGVCLIPPNGDTVTIAATGRSGFAWGTDSVAWFENDELLVRSLGKGTPRKVTWKNPPAMARDGVYAGR